MKLVILDPDERRRLLRRRRLNGADRFDEVWEGVYVMSPLADIEHQQLATLLAAFILQAIGDHPASVFAGINVSDRQKDWKRNYRCPDVAVYFENNPARNCRTHWVGGPDFAVEIVSPNDRSRKKGSFYASIETRELLVVDRRPWSLELFRLSNGSMELAQKTDVDDPSPIPSAVLPLTFRLAPGDPRPRIEVAMADGSRQWLV